jgi:heme-degrading monooxygenase HmoA
LPIGARAIRIAAQFKDREMEMYVAMNRFRVKPEAAEEFEKMWLTRESFLDQMRGFVSFQLLRGPSKADHVLFSSYTLWETRDDFEAWTRSGQFAASHKRAEGRPPMTMGHPEFEGFDVVQTVSGPGARPGQAA